MELVSSSWKFMGLAGHDLPLLDPLHLLSFHVISNGFPDYLLHIVPRGWGKAIWLKSFCLPLLKMGVMLTYFSLSAVIFQRWQLFLEWCQKAPSAPLDAANLLPWVACAQFAEVVPDPAFLYCRFQVIPIDSAGSLQGLQCLGHIFPLKNEEKKRDGVPLPFSCLLSLSPLLHWATCPHSH